MTDRWTDKLVGINEAGRILEKLSGQKITYHAVYFWINHNHIPTVRMGKRATIRERELKDFPITITAGHLAELIDRSKGDVANMA